MVACRFELVAVESYSRYCGSVARCRAIFLLCYALCQLSLNAQCSIAAVYASLAAYFRDILSLEPSKLLPISAIS